MTGVADLSREQQTHSPAPPTSRRAFLIGGIVIAVLAVGAGGGWLALRHDRPKDDPPPGAARSGHDSGEVVRVEVVHPIKGGVERTVTRPASVHSLEYAVLYAQASGYIKKQVVDIGDVVKKDQLLVEIDAPELWAQVEQAEANVEKATAYVGVAQARVAGSEADVEQAKSQVKQAETAVQRYTSLVTLRKAQYKRIYALAQKDAVEQELVDEKLQAQRAAEAEVVDARQAVLTAKSHVASAEANVQKAKADLHDARAQVKVAGAARTQAKARAGFTRITSPYDGVITARHFQVSDFVRNAAEGEGEPLLTVARTDVMRVIMYVPDPDVDYVHRGQKARLVVGSVPGRSFDGVISRTANAEDLNTRTMRVEVDLRNPKDAKHPQGLLKHGMYGEMTLFLGRTTQAVTLPTAALFGPQRDGQRTVYVVRDGKARHVKVRVGLDDGIRAEALSGLRPEDLVVVRHGPGLQDGSPVQVVEVPSAPEGKRDHPHAKSD